MQILSVIVLIIGLCLLIGLIALLFAYAGMIAGIAGWFLAGAVGALILGKLIKENSG